MGEQQQERHVLVIENAGAPQAISLQAVAYSIGRDPSNAIVLDMDTLSRQHAILLRVPNPGKNTYNYRLVDGNAAGKASTNGVFVNGQRCTTHTLVSGDQIGLGQKVKGRYFRVGAEPNEFNAYLQSIEYQSLKAEQVNPKATLVSEVEVAPSPRTTTTVATPSPSSPLSITSMPKPPHPLEALMSEAEELTLINTAPGPEEADTSMFPGMISTSMPTDAPGAAVSLKDTIHDTEPTTSHRPKLLPMMAGVACLVLAVVGGGLLLHARTGQTPTQPQQPSSQQVRSAS